MNGENHYFGLLTSIINIISEENSVLTVNSLNNL